MEIENIVFLKIEIVFADSIGLLKIDDPKIIIVNSTVYTISAEDALRQLKISGLFECHTYPKTLSKFSEIPAGGSLCLETETDSKLNVFFDEHYYPALNEIERLYKLLRWRYSLGSGKLNILSKNMFWSLDKENWNSIVSCPSPENIRVKVVHESPLDTILIKDLMEKGNAEPVFFELLREANSISRTNLESGFVIAVSALEVGVKYLIKNHIPQVEWLIDEIPSPPIEKIIREFFPQIISGFNLTEEQTRLLKSIITTRNKLVHSGKIENDRKTFFKMMNFINDFVFETIDSNLR